MYFYIDIRYKIALYLLAVDILSVAPVPLSMIWCCVDKQFLQTRGSVDNERREDHLSSPPPYLLRSLGSCWGCMPGQENYIQDRCIRFISSSGNTRSALYELQVNIFASIVLNYYKKRNLTLSLCQVMYLDVFIINRSARLWRFTVLHRPIPSFSRSTYLSEVVNLRFGDSLHK